MGVRNPGMAPVTPEQYDVVVVGAGFAGAATAFALLEHSTPRVLMLEREASAGAHASGKNAALLCVGVNSLTVAKHVVETKKFLHRLQSQDSTQKLFRPTGSVLLGSLERLNPLQEVLTTLHEEAQLFTKNHLPNFIPPQLREWLGKAKFDAVLWTPDDGVVEVRGLLGYFLEQAKRKGLEFSPSTEVQQMTFQNNLWQLETSQGKIHASVVVNAAGAWAESLGIQAGSKVRGLIPFRRHLYISEIEKNSAPTWPIVWNVDEEFYFRPEAGAWLLCPGDETAHVPEVPQPDPQVRALLAKKFSAHFPHLGALGVQQGWACLRTKCDTKPYWVDWDPELKKFFWAAGLGGHGMSSSVGLGRRAAQGILKGLS